MNEEKIAETKILDVKIFADKRFVDDIFCGKSAGFSKKPNL